MLKQTEKGRENGLRCPPPNWSYLCIQEGGLQVGYLSMDPSMNTVCGIGMWSENSPYSPSVKPEGGTAARTINGRRLSEEDRRAD